MNPILPLTAVASAIALLGSAPAASGAPVSHAPVEPPSPDPETPFSIEYGPSTEAPLDTGVSDAVSNDIGPWNLEALLATIRAGESSNRYNVLVGGGTFDLDHHPGWTDRSMTKKSAWAGVGNSHAAGAYQFQPGTFKEANDALGMDGSMSEANQDAAAVFLIRRRGAYDHALAGELPAVQSELWNEWEFFQKWNIGRLVAAYESNGGTVA